MAKRKTVRTKLIRGSGRIPVLVNGKKGSLPAIATIRAKNISTAKSYFKKKYQTGVYHAGKDAPNLYTVVGSKKKKKES